MRPGDGEGASSGMAPEGILGVVLAGGESRRFGENKALAPFRGRPMAAWVLDALSAHIPRCVTVANDPAVARVLGIPGRKDKIPGQGPLGGLVTALEWAAEDGLDGVFLLACDLPMVDGEMVGRILNAWPRGSLAVVPESAGPLGLEPLCAGYGTGGLSRLRRVAASDGRSMEDALRVLDPHLVPSHHLGPAEAISRAFTNVNTRADAQAVGPPVVCVVGRKNAGKTGLTVALAAELNRRGLKVMTVKHGHGFQVDRPGKDSWRHRHEGAAFRTVLAAPGDFAVVGNWPGEELPLGEIVRRFLSDADIVLAEGFKWGSEPKIEIFRGADDSAPLFDPMAPPVSSPLLALVTDQEGVESRVPLFRLDAPGSIEALADLVEKSLLGSATESDGPEEHLPGRDQGPR